MLNEWTEAAELLLRLEHIELDPEKRGLLERAAADGPDALVAALHELRRDHSHPASAQPPL